MDRKPFLLRLDPRVHRALARWAADDLRSLNGQIEFLLRRALRAAGRLRAPGGEGSVGEGDAAPPAAEGERQDDRPPPGRGGDHPS